MCAESVFEKPTVRTENTDLQEQENAALADPGFRFLVDIVPGEHLHLSDTCQGGIDSGVTV